MRAVAAAAALLAGISGLAAPAGAVLPRPVLPPVDLSPRGSADVIAYPRTAGARPASLVFTLRFEMQCGRVGAGPVVVVLPRALHVPKTIPRTAVRVAGVSPLAVRVSHRIVRIVLPRPQGISCMVLAPGTLRIAFLHAAGLGNPVRAGTYAIPVRVGARPFVAQLTVL